MIFVLGITTTHKQAPRTKHGAADDITLEDVKYMIIVLYGVVEHKIVKHMELFAPHQLVCTKPQKTSN